MFDQYCELSSDLRRLAGVMALVVVVFSAVTAGAQTTEDKPVGFQVLTIGGGARAVGLAETMTSGSVDDPFVLEYNPAGLTTVEHFTVAFAHNAFFLDTRGEYLATAVPMGRWALGARVGYMGTSDLPRRTGPTEDPLYLYDASDGIVQGAIAGPVDERLSVGVSAAWVFEHIDVTTAQTAILGIGVIYALRPDFSFGVSFMNVGPPAKYIEQEVKMPSQLRMGARWMRAHLTTRAEVVAAENDNVKWHVAGEYELDPRLSFRGGVKIGYDTHWFALGFGARLPDGRFGVDYAFAPYTDDLGTTHRLGLVVRP